MARNSSFKPIVVLVLIIALMLLASCSEVTTPQTAPTSNSTIPSETTIEKNAYGPGEFKKYTPTITATFGYPHDVNSKRLLAMAAVGEPLEDNRWIKYFREDVGVECEYSLLAANAVDYNQKLLMAMTANELPDIFLVTDLSFFKQLIEANAIADLTSVYADNANTTLLELMEYEGKNIYNPVTVEGKLYGIPVKMPSTNGYNHCWVRQDWLDKLNLDRPKTMDDVMAIAKSFKENNMGGNGNIGLMLNNGYINESKGIFWAFGGQAANRKYWSTLSDGSVGFSEVQPEMKGGLAWLADMYSQDLVNKEFATQDVSTAFKYVANNQCGIFYGPHWYGFSLYSAAETMDKDADWVAVGLPTGTDSPTKVYATNTFDGVTCVNAKYDNPDAAVQLLNAYVEKLFGESNDFSNYFSSPENDGLWIASPIHVLHPLVDLTPHRQMKEAVAKGTTDKLTGSAKSYWQNISNGIRSYDYMFGVKDSCFNFVDETYPEIISWNRYMGAPTPTWADRWSSMKELIDTSYLSIILGDVELDEGFNEMVEQWNSIGGEQVTKEVNEIVADY